MISLMSFGWLRRRSMDRIFQFTMMVGIRLLGMVEGLISCRSKYPFHAKSQGTISLRASWTPRTLSPRFTTILTMFSTKSRKPILTLKSSKFTESTLEGFGQQTMLSMLRDRVLFKRESITHPIISSWPLISR